MFVSHGFDGRPRRSATLTLAACSALALLLSACESSGGYRISSVGSGSPGSGSDSDGGSDSGGGGGGGSDNGGGSGSDGSGGGTGSSGSTGNTVSAGLEQLSPVLATAGNAVLGVSDGQGNVTTPIATALPVTEPVTGTITRVLTDTGTVLVDAGEGRTLLLQGAQGAVGDVVSIDVGGRTVTTGMDGTPGAIGAGVLGDSQPVGTLASVGVLNAGNTALATVNGVADVRVTNITSPTGGIADNLLNVALGGNQLLGNGDPALVNANVLPGGAGAGNIGGVIDGVLPSGGGATDGVLGPVHQVLGGVSGGGGTGAQVGAGAGAGAGASVDTGGALAPVTDTVSGAVNGLTGALRLSH